MFNIEMAVATKQFSECWRSAVSFLMSRADTGALNWMKVDLVPPVLEHMSFRLANQLFFVRVIDVDGRVEGPGGREGLVMIAEGCRGHACEMLMARRSGSWAPVLPGWGLRDLVTHAPIDPPALVSDELIEMSDWELHDFGIQIVRQHLESEGRKIMSTPSKPDIFPSLWFVGDSGPEWVVVVESRYPQEPAALPVSWSDVQQACKPMSETGHLAIVIVANANDPRDGEPGSVLPLWRGHALTCKYSGLLQV